MTAGRVCIDSGSTVDVVEDLVIRDRRHLSEDGIVLAIITINKLSGKVEASAGGGDARIRWRGRASCSRQAGRW